MVSPYLQREWNIGSNSNTYINRSPCHGYALAISTRSARLKINMEGVLPNFNLCNHFHYVLKELHLHNIHYHGSIFTWHHGDIF